MTETMAEAIARIRVTHERGSSADWMREIPAGSHWFPGCPGDPFCEVCQGTGFVTLALPLGHPDYGKIFLCDCIHNSKARSRVHQERMIMGVNND